MLPRVGAGGAGVLLPLLPRKVVAPPSAPPPQERQRSPAPTLFPRGSHYYLISFAQGRLHPVGWRWDAALHPCWQYSTKPFTRGTLIS